MEEAAQPRGRHPADRDHIRAAIQDGSGLEVIYFGGSHPGMKRIIFPRAIVGHLLHAHDDRSSSYRSFRLNKLFTFSPDDPAEWVPKALKHTKIDDPREFFSAWHYVIRPELWPALGVTLREYIDPAPTKRAREAALAKGLDKKAVARISVTIMCYASAGRDAIEFHEGDIFYGQGSSDPALQVLRVGRYLEVHAIDKLTPSRSPYRITADEFADWLETGAVPTHGRIAPMESDVKALFDHMR
ncbi:hypothetical protein [Thauera sp.]|uniref:hypothetical protein n=1 Tax=Thauera sp. TaxID=1905334 RepID=UPI0039E435BD